MHFKKRIVLVSVLLVLFFTVSPSFAHASLWDDFKNGVKSFFSGDESNGNKNKNISIDATIELAPEGDADQNGEISSGDIVRFTYTLSNPSEKEYKLGTLTTNIDRKMLHFIHNVRAVNLDDTSETIKFPNVRLLAGETEQKIGFDARINYYDDSDKILTTEAEFLDKDNKLISKSQKKEVKATKLKIMPESKKALKE